MSSTKIADLSGQSFGRLTVIERAPKEPRFNGASWSCRCVCGRVVVVGGSPLRLGLTKSCGCYAHDRWSRQARERFTTHGASGSPEHQAWLGMRRRCYEPERKDYHLYGGRGITICDRWREDFAAFLEDMGPRPKGTSIDRLDNDGPYCLANCKWSTPTEQANNRRSNRRVAFAGETKTVMEWARAIGIPNGALWLRLFRRHWSIDRALTDPLHR